jgi:predicted dehydrogenase
MNKEILNQKTSRRDFLGKVGLGVAALSIAPGYSFIDKHDRIRKIRIGIVGGGFGSAFCFHEDPNCIVEAVSDLRPERRDILQKAYHCSKSYESLEKLILDPKIDAVFIATEAPNHVRHAIAVLNSGKHVLSCVPAAMTIEDCYKLRNAVRTTGLTYMMAETSFYRQNTISVRKFFQEGLFGNVFSAAAEYNHPGLQTYFFENGKPTWRHGLPPLQYPTHCTSFLVSVTGERLTHVSALGWGDNSPLLKDNPYNNPFWNETAFFKTNKGNPFRVEVNWRGALRGAERGEWRGDKMSFLSDLNEGNNHTIIRVAEKTGYDDAGFKYDDNIEEAYKQPMWWETDLLPEPMRHNTGHGGSHGFITHEFIDALLNERKPAIDIYEALAYTAPGIVGHQSALRDGEYMIIPDFDN